MIYPHVKLIWTTVVFKNTLSCGLFPFIFSLCLMVMVSWLGHHQQAKDPGSHHDGWLKCLYLDSIAKSLEEKEEKIP